MKFTMSETHIPLKITKYVSKSFCSPNILPELSSKKKKRTLYKLGKLKNNFSFNDNGNKCFQLHNFFSNKELNY